MRKPTRSPGARPAPPREAAEPDGNVRAVDRALALLLAFGDDDPALPLAEIARRTGLHMTTALRLLGTLERHGFVQRVAGGYALGPQLLVLGERFRRGLEILQGHGLAARNVGERAQALCLELVARRAIHLEIQPIVRDEGKHAVALINPIATEHRAYPQSADKRHLIDDQFHEITASRHSQGTS